MTILDPHVVNSDLWKRFIALSNSLIGGGFPDSLYEFLSEILDLDHFTVLVINAARVTENRVAFCAGDVTNYWAKYSAQYVADYSKKINRPFDHNLELIAKNLIEAEGVFRFRPDREKQMEIASLYDKNNLVEKIYGLHLDEGTIFQLNIFRRIKDGPFSDAEIESIKPIMPLLMDFVVLHYRRDLSSIGRQGSQRHVVSYLKENGIAQFAPLTAQETEVCDLIIYGQTTEGIAAEMGISVSTVKTYRERAYRKLQINSKSELFSIIINSQIYSS